MSINPVYSTVTCGLHANKQSITQYECYYLIIYDLLAKTFHYETKAAHAQRDVCVS